PPRDTANRARLPPARVARHSYHSRAKARWVKGCLGNVYGLSTLADQCGPPPRPLRARGAIVAPFRSRSSAMTRMKTALTVALALGTIGLGAQPPAVTVDGDDITIRGCVTEAGTSSAAAPSVLVWSRSDIMLAAAETLGEHAAVTGRVFYWLDDEE